MTPKFEGIPGRMMNLDGKKLFSNPDDDMHGKQLVMIFFYKYCRCSQEAGIRANSSRGIHYHSVSPDK